MRKIEQKMIAAMRAGRSCKQGNTEYDNESGRLYLHGHCIARTVADGPDNWTWEFNLCGWNTPTTRSRINALAREFVRPGVWNKQHCPMTGNALTPTPAPLNGWF